MQATTGPALAVIADGDRWALDGELVIRTLTEARRALRQWGEGSGERALELGGLRGLDTPGALSLSELRHGGVALTGLRPEHEALLALVEGLDVAPLPAADNVPRWRQLVIGAGRSTPTKPCATRTTSLLSSGAR